MCYRQKKLATVSKQQGLGQSISKMTGLKSGPKIYDWTPGVVCGKEIWIIWCIWSKLLKDNAHYYRKL